MEYTNIARAIGEELGALAAREEKHTILRKATRHAVSALCTAEGVAAVSTAPLIDIGLASFDVAYHETDNEIREEQEAQEAAHRRACARQEAQEAAHRRACARQEHERLIAARDRHLARKAANGA